MFSFVSLSFFYNFDFWLFFCKCFCSFCVFFFLFFCFISCLRNFVEVLILLSCCFYAPCRGDLVRSAAKSSAFSLREREREGEKRRKERNATKEDLLIEIIRWEKPSSKVFEIIRQVCEADIVPYIKPLPIKQDDTIS